MPAFTFGGAGAEIRLRVNADFDRHNRTTFVLRATAETVVEQVLAQAAQRVKLDPADLALCWHFKALRNDRTIGWHEMGSEIELQLEKLPLPAHTLPAHTPAVAPEVTAAIAAARMSKRRQTRELSPKEQGQQVGPWRTALLISGDQATLEADAASDAAEDAAEDAAAC